MGTIVTITCERDKYQMELQALTINKYWTVPHKHYVVIEDTENIDEWYGLLGKYYTTHTLCILSKKTNPELFSKTSVHGYTEQMLIKLRMANIVDTPYYLVLDSKIYFYNYFNKPLAGIEGSGESLDISNESLASFRPFILAAANYFNKKPLEAATFPATPFVFKTVNVLKMFDFDIDKLFLDFLKSGDFFISEFLAYAYFADFYDNDKITERGASQFGSTFWSFHRFDVQRPEHILRFKTDLKDIDNTLIDKVLDSLAKLDENRIQHN